MYALAPDFVTVIDDDGGGTAAVSNGGEPAVVAFPGPIAAPARWHADDNVATVAPAVTAALEVPDHDGPMALVVDRYNAPGPAAKEGVLVRGKATTLRGGRFVLRPETIAEWDGVAVRQSQT